LKSNRLHRVSSPERSGCKHTFQVWIYRGANALDKRTTAMNERSHSIQSMKEAFPFQLGTTSYILPADLVANVEFLGPLVDDVEIVLFECDTASNLPDPDVIERLVELKHENRLSYTVHLPLDILLGSHDEARRILSVEKCLRVINVTKPLAPFAYIVHFHRERRDQGPAQEIHRWRRSLDCSVRDLLAAGADHELLSIETLDYPFQYVTDIVFSHGLSICLDVGHLAFYGYPIREYLDRYMARCRVIHLHGNSDGADHKDIGTLHPHIIEMLVNRIGLESGKKRVLTLEVFGREEFRRSMEIMGRWTG